MNPPVILLAAALLSAVAGVTALLVLRRRLLVVTVDGHSMRPTLEPGDRVLVRRGSAARARAGAITVLRHPAGPGTWLPLPPEAVGEGGQIYTIKRLAAVPGDRVPGGLGPGTALVSGAAVPPGCLLVLGDNPAQSVDSRQLGLIPAEYFVGVVARRLGR
ncbi:S26 family signal peptidase [Planomonospora sp. ID91781]|uniref:S26 family signal peptidase n=1 Tax=Planomonospora sp. ID91781 TaxID=2738135 RepID=UPI0018C3D6BB|nr:S26 family signal peptidase [Planomonospora sp. ID91781]